MPYHLATPARSLFYHFRNAGQELDYVQGKEKCNLELVIIELWLRTY